MLSQTSSRVFPHRQAQLRSPLPVLRPSVPLQRVAPKTRAKPQQRAKELVSWAQVGYISVIIIMLCCALTGHVIMTRVTNYLGCTRVTQLAIGANSSKAKTLQSLK